MPLGWMCIAVLVVLVLACGGVLALILGWAAWGGRTGRRCPRCRRRALERCHAAEPPAPSFYRCRRCDARLRRVLQGLWHDASGAEYDAMFPHATARDR
jgi:hypothetical protein